jgi:transcriptional regulator with XRE-family HTH domain
MEFNEKLQELRKSRSLTQEELASALFVSRTAVSKWESGRGYPNLDSLRQISRYFSVSIDELICPEEIISAAEDDKKACVGRVLAMICGAMDSLSALLLFLPIFGNGTGSSGSVPLFALTGCSPWIKTTFAAVIALTGLNGICGVVISHWNHPVWDRHRLVTGMALSVIGSAVFVMTRQPYAGILFLAILVVKGWLIGKWRGTP